MPVSLKIFLICWFIGWGGQFLYRREPRVAKLLLVSAICVLGMFCVGVALGMVREITPKYDFWLHKADWALGWPAFLAGRLIMPTPLYGVLVVVYETLPAVLLLVYAVHLFGGGTPDRVLAGFALNFAAGYFLYFLLPACGPMYAFAGFPRVAPHLEKLRVVSLAFNPNCMPSLHTSTALLAVWFCRRWPVARAVAFLNLGIILLATLATGEHYLIDLVVAVPYAAFVYAAASGQVRAAAGWLALVLGWIAFLRFGLVWMTPAPVPFACACAMTVLAVLYGRRNRLPHQGTELTRSLPLLLRRAHR